MAARAEAASLGASDWRVRYSYLPEQFAEIEDILDEFRRFVPTGDFTLGRPLADFEERFAELIGTKYAIGVGSGTDALKLGLKAAGVGHGDEVITAANTFIATVGAINELGARPVFVDCDDGFCMDVDQVEAAISPKTRAILPVQLTGNIPGIRVPSRRPGVRHVFHLYMVFAEDRDALFRHCVAHGVECKVHYPIPLYQQDGLRAFGYQPGDFPVADRQATEIITLPADQHLEREHLDMVIETVREFYAGR